MNLKESDCDSAAEAHHRGRTAVDILRAPLELPRPSRRPPTMKHPIFSAPCKTSKYKPGADFSPTFWKVVRELRLEEELGKVTITELVPSPRSNVDEPIRLKSQSSEDSDSSYGGLASGETSSSSDEGDVEDVNETFNDENRSYSPIKRVKSLEEPTVETKLDSTSDLDSD